MRRHTVKFDCLKIRARREAEPQIVRNELANRELEWITTVIEDDPRSRRQLERRDPDLPVRMARFAPWLQPGPHEDALDRWYRLFECWALCYDEHAGIDVDCRCAICAPAKRD